MSEGRDAVTEIHGVSAPSVDLSNRLSSHLSLFLHLIYMEKHA